MEIVYKKLDDLKPYKRNARTHSAEQIDLICRSIREYGFTNPVLIDEKNNIIAGHGRVESAKRLAMNEVPCIVLSHLTEAQKKAYVIADNKMALNAGWNDELLKMELEDLKDLDFDLSLTGFNTFEIDNILGSDEEENYQDIVEDEFDDIEKLDKHYGVPYQGNKSRIADIIINILPSGKRLVDLFGGGGAITHCALLSNKWNSQLYNDINKMITNLFMDAIHGRYHDENRVISREQFEQLKDTDAYVKYIWNFGNGGKAYLWGKNIEQEKCLACEMIFEPNVQERRLKYSQLIKMLKNSNDSTANKLQALTQLEELQRLEAIERLQALTQLEELQRLEALQRLEVSNISYKEYEYQDGDIVYCDIPYEKIGKNKSKDYEIEFDNIGFYEWCKKQPYQIYFSSYEISDDSFYKVKIKQVVKLMGSSTNNQYANEFLYSNKPIKISEEEENV